MTTEKRICQICGQEFETEQGVLNRRKYCSDECARLGHIRTVLVKRIKKREESVDCVERTCLLYNARFKNNCSGLERAFESNCPFYKKKKNKKKKEM